MAPSRAPSVAPSRASTSHSASRSHAPSQASTSKQTTTATSSAGERYTIAVHEQRGVGREIGLAMFQQDIAKVILTQFSDSSTCVKSLHLFNSKRPGVLIVLPSTAGVGLSVDHKGETPKEQSILVHQVATAFDDCQIVPVHRKTYNELAGLTFVETLILDNDERSAAMTPLRKKPFALSAASALFKYLESQRVSFPPGSLKILYQPLEGTCLIDQDTIKYLELVQNMTNKKSKQSLFGALNHTITPGGARLLRSTILSPLTDAAKLNERLDAVAALKENEARLTMIRKALEPIRTLDIEKLVASIATYDADTTFIGSGRSIKQLSEIDPAREADKNLGKIFQLRLFMTAVPALKAGLDHNQTEALEKASELLSKKELGEILKEINETLNPDVVAAGASRVNQFGSRTTKVYAIKAEKDPLLDVARETWQENVTDFATFTDELKQKYKMPIDFQYSASSGVVLRALKDDIPSTGLPKIFTNVVNKGAKQIEFSCLELKKRNARFNAAVDEILMQSNKVLRELFVFVRGRISVLYQAAESIAMVDLLASFADIASKNDYIRPEFGRSLAIKAGRHILHERFRALDGTFQPNDTFASEACSFQIITGPNMAGKSVLLRQIALFHVCAQIGSFVPAGYCSIKLCSAILTRLGNDDSVQDSLSTFSKEVLTMGMILSTLSTVGHSLVIVDELGRGTSPEEGVGLAHALAARIIRAKATCFFATHFKELPTTLSLYPTMVTYHLHAEVDRRRSDFSMIFSHRVVPGITPMAHYGLELVKTAKLPADVLAKAAQVSGELDEMEQEGKKRLAGSTVVLRRKALLELRTSLRDLATYDHLTSKEITERMQLLQNNLVYSLAAAIENEKESGRPEIGGGEGWTAEGLELKIGDAGDEGAMAKVEAEGGVKTEEPGQGGGGRTYEGELMIVEEEAGVV